MSELRLFTCPYGFSYRQPAWMLISIARGDRLAASTSASLAEYVRSKTMQAPTSNLVMSQPERRMPTANTWALLVEDDAEIGALIARYLEANQISVTVVETGEELDQALQKRGYDILILDINLPGEGGLSICRRIRSNSDTPIIFVTALGEDVDKIVGLEMGADDYLSKPFNPRELLARMRAILRRPVQVARRADAQLENVYRFSGWSVNVSAREVIGPAGTKLAMTGAEFDLLYALCEHPNRVLTRDQLIGLTHGAIEGPTERSIDTLVSRLRQKMEADPKHPMLIQTVRSEGYIFAAQVTRR